MTQETRDHLVTLQVELKPLREAELRAAMADADPPVLLMVYMQFTADREFMERFRPHIKKLREYADTTPADLIDELHERLVDVLCRERAPSPVEIPQGLLREMITICVGEPVPDEYMPMLLEDLAVERDDPAADFAATPAKEGFPSDFRVAIVGAGFSGICAAIQLRRAGIEFELYEKNAGPGGTWWENTYPGCGVDTANHWYSYSFALKDDWSRYFVKQPELLDYINECIERFDVRRSLALNTQVTSARFDSDSSLWKLELLDADGVRRTSDANALVCAVGQLNNPSIPDIPGCNTFTGDMFHTARWPAGFDVAGKRVALIGTGASGTQVAPAIASEVRQLDIYQREPHWLMKRANYERLVEPGKKWALRNIPYYARWYRFQLFWAFGDALYGALERDPSWPNHSRSVGTQSETVRRTWNEYLEQSLAERPDLLEKSRPGYPPYGKRPLFDNGWFAMLKRPNVGLIRERIAEITPSGITTEDGQHRDCDVIIFATGFHASKMVYSLEVTGSNGRTLKETWDEDNPRAYIGMTVTGFPNLFLMYGPNTNYAHGGSIVFNAERQAGYILRALTLMKRLGAPTMDVSEAAFQRYDHSVDALHARLVWSVEGLQTWYKNARGRVTTNSPWKLLDYWRLTGSIEEEDYRFGQPTRTAN